MTRRTTLIALVALAVPLAALWAITFRPQSLGGPADYLIVAGTSMEPTLSPDDLVVVRERPSYDTGDVVAYHVPEGHPQAGAQIIHRIVGGNPHDGYVTRGDDRDTTDLWRPHPDDIIGERRLHIPAVGLAVRLIRHPVGLGTLAALTTFTAVVTATRRDDDDHDVTTTGTAPKSPGSVSRPVAPRTSRMTTSPGEAPERSSVTL